MHTGWSSISHISPLQRQKGMKWEIWVQLTGQLELNLLRNQSSWKKDKKEKHPKELLINFSIQNTNLKNEFRFQKQCRSCFSPVFALHIVSVFLVYHLLPGASWTGEMCYHNKTAVSCFITVTFLPTCGCFSAVRKSKSCTQRLKPHDVVW